jgi:hypothetical protein
MKRVLLALGAAGLLVAALVLLNQVRGGGPRHPAAPASPLTDVAPAPRVAPPTAAESPEQRLARLPPSSQPEAPAPPVVLPKDMPDPSRPPQWTQPLTTPKAPVPPDPFKPPEIAQDPNRGRRE